MALDKSVLNDEIIKQLLMEKYKIEPSSIRKLKLGSANCYLVNDGTNCYFLKEFQSGFSEEAVVREAILSEYLSHTDVPAKKIYRTLDQTYVFRYRDHLICLEEYVEGNTYDYNDLPEELLPAVARMLGKIHRALKDYPLPIEMGEKWVHTFSKDTLVGQYRAVMEIAEKRTEDVNCTWIIEDLRYRELLAEKCETYKKYYDNITYCSSHGDYHGCQLVFDQNEISAVIDFSSASCMPVVWEIMRSFLHSSMNCRKNTVIDIPSLCAYVKEYMQYAPLTDNDLNAMPYVYLIQLIRSKYGYPQYLNSDSEDRESLLQFAHWRTKMCSEIEKKAEEIACELLKLKK